MMGFIVAPLPSLPLNTMRRAFVLTACVLCSCSDDKPSGPGPTQQQFCGVVRKYIHDYVEAFNAHKNEVVLSQLRTDRKQALHSMMRGGQEVDWSGKVSRISTDSNGTAHLTVVLLCGPPLSFTGPTLFGPDILLRDSPSIEKDSSVYSDLGKVTEGEEISFSGEFKYRSDHWDDFINENSATEIGSMTRPEFSFSFSDVRSAPH